MKLVLVIVLLNALLFSLTSCAPTNVAEPMTTRVVYEPTPPEGVVRYCWEEPIVDEEKVDAGLDSEGKWYNPGHVAIREVRMGKWRPCREITSRTYGRYGNER